MARDKTTYTGFINTPMSDYVDALKDTMTMFDVPEQFAKKQDPHVAYQIFEKDIQYRVTPLKSGELRANLNIILNIYGSQGSGKSVIGLSLYHLICQYAGRKPDIREIFFSINDIHVYTKEMADKGDLKSRCILLDEQMSTERYGMGSAERVDKLFDIIRIIRDSQVSFIMISPDNVFNFPAHYCIEAWRKNFRERSNLSFLIEMRNKRPITIMATPLMFSLEGDFNQAYLKKKRAFIQKFASQKEDDISTEIRDKAEKMCAEDRFINCYNKMLQLDLYMQMFGKASNDFMQTVCAKAEQMLLSKGGFFEKPKRFRSKGAGGGKADDQDDVHDAGADQPDRFTGETDEDKPKSKTKPEPKPKPKPKDISRADADDDSDIDLDLKASEGVLSGFAGAKQLEDQIKGKPKGKGKSKGKSRKDKE
ncbi:hypothetical protein GQ472_01610 [archaeon]|nr:hypothetical protein [archaeon]